MDKIDIYTDASHFFGHNLKSHIFGYSSVILTDDKEYVLRGSISRKIVRNYFKINCRINDLSIDHGEMVSIAKALWQFRKESYNLRIFSDSLNSLTRIKKLMNGDRSSKKFNNLTEFILSIINKIENNGGSVEMFWVKSHKGCYGNNLADKFAKDMFVPNVKKRKMSENERQIFNRMNRKKRSSWRNKIISNEAFNEICKYNGEFFFDREVNEFPEYKESLKRDSIESNIPPLQSYTENIKKVFKYFFDNTKNSDGSKVRKVGELQSTR